MGHNFRAFQNNARHQDRRKNHYRVNVHRTRCRPGRLADESSIDCKRHPNDDKDAEKVSQEQERVNGAVVVLENDGTREHVEGVHQEEHGEAAENEEMHQPPAEVMPQDSDLENDIPERILLQGSIFED